MFLIVVSLAVLVVSVAFHIYAWRRLRHLGLVDEVTVEVGYPDNMVHLELKASTITGGARVRCRMHPAHAREVSGDLLRAHAGLQGVRTRDDSPAPKNTRRETAAS